MQSIHRIGNATRWADVVVHAGVARWVEVATNMQPDCQSQVKQILNQIDDTLTELGSNRRALLQVQIYLADLAEIATLNQLWDAWIPAGHAPVRACVQVGLGALCRAEFIVTAAVP